ncbi:UvrD-helicase domain-containing protein [Brevundimonas sp. TWP3-1-2b1]|uniref:UvrD-helicase domain-containing protein n=1 Tax=Brevundimonas sp. TWP3-1-2b1 TaxID=2804650 RepID=UPI003CF0AD09
MDLIKPEAWSPPAGVQLDSITMEAVRSSASAVIVAGPGAGKTELLAQRAAFLLMTGGCPAPRRILAISFKRDAARNLHQRVVLRAGEDFGRRLESYTFDAFAKSLIDRFGSTLPAWCRPARSYEIAFPGWRDWDEFAGRLRRQGINQNGSEIEKRHATLTIQPGPLPADESSELLVNASGVAWWQESLNSTPPRLTFGMIATLAMTLLAHNPLVRAALRQTYSHVFLDEFQDTTTLQYELFKNAFLGSDAVITAVGDSKQTIMTFAGAKAGIFSDFARDFAATPIALSTNFRSNVRIVEIVNSMARVIEPDAVLVNSARRAALPPKPLDQVLNYRDAAHEADDLAAMIASEVRAGDRTPEDFMLLVRQSAPQVEAQLAPRFAAHGLTLRNEARSMGSIQIQELMTEPLADLVANVVQMGAGDREGAPFHRVRTVIGAVFGEADGRPASEARVERAIRDAVAVVRNETGSAPSPEAVPTMVAAIVAAFGEAPLAQLSPDYARPKRFAEIQAGTVAFLQESAVGASDWAVAVRRFRGADQVRLMTIHKSKGLEADTVIFLHLQDSGFNRNANMKEEALIFFVAASRARERFFVTSTSTERRRVQPLWEMMTAAGIGDSSANARA